MESYKRPAPDMSQIQKPFLKKWQETEMHDLLDRIKEKEKILEKEKEKLRDLR